MVYKGVWFCLLLERVCEKSDSFVTSEVLQGLCDKKRMGCKSRVGDVGVGQNRENIRVCDAEAYHVVR